MSQPDTRTRLVLAAMHLFWEKGYNSTSIADVLQAAKVNSGSLYHFFPGKQDLLLAVLDMYHSGIHEMLLEPAWRDVADPIEKVMALLARYRAALVDTECFYGCPIGSLALELHEPDPPVRERLAKNFDAWTTAVQQCLDAAGGRLPPDVDRRHLAEFVLTTMEGAVMQARTFRDVGYFDRAVAQLARYFDALQREPCRSRTGSGPRASDERKKEKSMTEINVWAVVAAAASAFVLGGLWYSPALFGKAWQRETGLTDEALKRGNMGLIFGLSFLLSLLAAAVFALFLGPAPALPFALGAAVSAGACWVAASFGINYLFERKSAKLFLINGAYHTAQFTLYGLVLGLWH